MVIKVTHNLTSLVHFSRILICFFLSVCVSVCACVRACVCVCVSVCLPYHVCLSVCLPVYFCFNRGDDTTGEARLRSDWNKHVMKDVIAPLYALLLAKACTYLQTLPEISSSSVLSLIQTYEGDALSIKSKKNEENNMSNTNTEEHSSQYSSSVKCFTVESSSPYSILSLFPCPVPSDCWGSVPRHLFPLLADQRILFSRSSGGSYLSLRQAILLESRTNISTFLSVHSNMNSSSLSSSTFSAIDDSVRYYHSHNSGSCQHHPV